ncbi:MAG: hypothetical protein LAT51_13340 [Flavobacteriaceae bacterium]|nr:hypothetical protein [Flavobacteriaceae bacterium]
MSSIAKLILLFTIFYILGIANCFSQNVSVEIVENDELEVLINSARFGLPELITSDEGFIYVTDAQAMNIKVFNKESMEHYTFGRRGRGPGEFMNFDLITSYSKSLYVFDTVLNSKYVKISSEGEIIDEILIKPEGSNRLFRPRQVVHSKDGYKLFLYNNFSDNKDILHAWSPDLQHNFVSHLDQSKTRGSSGFANALNSSTAGSSVEIYNGKWIYVSRVPFDGLHITNPATGEYTFTPVTYESEAYSETTNNRYRDKVFMRHNSAEGSFSGYVFRMNAGLFKASEEFLVHFTAEHSLSDSGEANNWNLHATVFDKGLNVVSNQKLIKNVSLLSFNLPAVRHRDENGNYFFIHYDADEFPHISVFTLNFNEKVN